jgi:hypothetical protein
MSQTLEVCEENKPLETSAVGNSALRTHYYYYSSEVLSTSVLVRYLELF